MTYRNSIKFRLQIEINYLVDLEQCNYFFMGDGTCHELNNKPMCDYDGWDCLKNCHLPQAIGDGFCDTLTNSEECVFDGGDCCLEGGMDYMFTLSMFDNCIHEMIVPSWVNGPCICHCSTKLTISKQCCAILALIYVICFGVKNCSVYPLFT